MINLTQWLLGLALASGSPSGAQLNRSDDAPVQTVNRSTQPETQIPPEYVQTVEFLLAHGFADPRGGVLSRATVLYGDEWRPQPKATDVVGWLMPKQPGKPRQIVLPNGLAYDVLSVHGPVNAKELELPAAKELWKPINGHLIGDPVAGLLICGEKRLAGIYFRRLATRPVLTYGDREEYFLELAGQYVESKFLRALQARAAGNDRLALSDSENLKANREAFRRESVRWWPRSYGGLRVLNNLEYLIEDSKARLTSRTPQKLDLKRVLSLPRKLKVASLMNKLDEVAVGGWLPFGSAFPIEDPVFKAIVSQGTDAVEPLLNAMVFDRRWTRSYATALGFDEELHLVSDREMAYQAFIAITQYEDRARKATPDVKTLRAYWQDNKDLTPSGRWLKVLADDRAGEDRWVFAAHNVIISGPPVSLHAPPGSKDFRPTNDSDMSIRMRKDPALSALLAKRIQNLLTLPLKQYEQRRIKIFYAMQMAHEFYEWDPRASLTWLKRVTQAVVTYKPGKYEGPVLEHAGTSFAEVIEDRLELHDEQAVDDYVAAVKESEPETGSIDSAIFEPLLSHVSDPKFGGLANHVFAEPGSKWNLSNMIRTDAIGFSIRTVVASPLIKLQLWRDDVLASMHDKTPMGHVQVCSANLLFVSEKNQGADFGTDWLDLSDPKLPEANTTVEYRVCDLVACMVSHIRGAPKCHIYWPVEDRDRAVAAEIEYLKQNANSISKLLPQPGAWQMFSDLRRVPSKASS